MFERLVSKMEEVKFYGDCTFAEILEDSTGYIYVVLNRPDRVSGKALDELSEKINQWKNEHEI